uniref:Uncharacterized protein n=1 Tax=Steinernema glaseri TaxID=37863 RepID=A0A1I7Z3E7_9BILA
MSAQPYLNQTIGPFDLSRSPSQPESIPTGSTRTSPGGRHALAGVDETRLGLDAKDDVHDVLFKRDALANNSPQLDSYSSSVSFGEVLCRPAYDRRFQPVNEES